MEWSEKVVLLTEDARVRDVVESTAAALGLPVAVVADAEGLARRWNAADVVLVGGDRAAALASLGPARRAGVYLVGFDSADLAAWSVPLAAGVIPLPQGVAWLTGVLAADTESESRLVAVVGGSGGVGASTLAAGLALAAVARGNSAALVDLDPLGGGVDLLLGAERAPGWRWSRLAGARGEVGDVRGVLPVVEGVTVVGMGRGAEAEAPASETVHAVLGSLGRHHELVVLDGGRAPLPPARQALRAADRVLLVVGTGVRAVSAGIRTREHLELEDAGLVARHERGGAPPAAVAEALGLPLFGVVPREPRLPEAAEAGDPPPLGRRRWARAVAAILDRLESSDQRGA